MHDDYNGYRNQLGLGFQELYAAMPEVGKAFGGIHQAASKDGKLDSKTKELMAVAISAVIRCEGCIALHVYNALKAGATDDELHETLGVAVMMGGGPAMVAATEAMQAAKDFRKKMEY